MCRMCEKPKEANPGLPRQGQRRRPVRSTAMRLGRGGRSKRMKSCRSTILVWGRLWSWLVWGCSSCDRWVFMHTQSIYFWLNIWTARRRVHCYFHEPNKDRPPIEIKASQKWFCLHQPKNTNTKYIRGDREFAFIQRPKNKIVSICVSVLLLFQ